MKIISPFFRLRAFRLATHAGLFECLFELHRSEIFVIITAAAWRNLFGIRSRERILFSPQRIRHAASLVTPKMCQLIFR